MVSLKIITLFIKINNIYTGAIGSFLDKKTNGYSKIVLNFIEGMKSI